MCNRYTIQDTFSNVASHLSEAEKNRIALNPNVIQEENVS